MLSKRIIQILALQLGCLDEEITRERIAAVPYRRIRQMPEIGQASLRAIRAWMQDGGYHSTFHEWVQDQPVVSPHLDLKGEFTMAAHLMTSIEADFENRTWTFQANHFRCGGGEYVVISKHDWDRIWYQFETQVTRSPQSEGISNV